MANSLTFQLLHLQFLCHLPADHQWFGSWFLRILWCVCVSNSLWNKANNIIHFCSHVPPINLCHPSEKGYYFTDTCSHLDVLSDLQKKMHRGSFPVAQDLWPPWLQVSVGQKINVGNHRFEETFIKMKKRKNKQQKWEQVTGLWTSL